MALHSKQVFTTFGFSPEFALLVLGLRWRGRGFTSDLSEAAAAAAAEPDLFTTVEADGVGESGLLFSSPELLPVEPELTPLELFKTRPLLEPPGTAGMIEVGERGQPTFEYMSAACEDCPPAGAPATPP